MTLEVPDQLVPLGDGLMLAGEIVDVGQIPAPPCPLFEFMAGKYFAAATTYQQSQILGPLPTEVAEALSEGGEISSAKHLLQAEELELSIPPFGASGFLVVLLVAPARVVGDLLVGAPVYTLSERGTPPVCVFSGVWCLAVCVLGILRPTVYIFRV